MLVYILFTTKTFLLITDLPVDMWYIKQAVTISNFIRQRQWKRKRLWWRLLGWSDMFSYWRWTAEVDLHHHSCHRSLLSSDCSHFSNYRIWNASGKSGTRVKGKSTTISTNGLAPKKKHTAGGSNLMSEIEHLLASRSNWYEIDSTPQNQYPGVFPPQNPDSPSPGLKRMGHIVDCSKLPQFTEGNPHLL